MARQGARAGDAAESERAGRWRARLGRSGERLGPGREREEWAAERVGPRVLSWVWVALGWFQVWGFGPGGKGLGWAHMLELGLS